MIMYEQDVGVLHWGLPILDVCCISTRGSPGSKIYYDQDLSRVEYVNEGYGETKHDEVENDEIIAQAFQEELSLLADAKASGSSYAGDKNLQASILTQDWLGTSKRHYSLGTMEEPAECGHDLGDVDEREESNSCSSMKEKAFGLEDGSYLPEIADESTLDGDVGNRLNQMVPVPHVPKINGYIPSVDEETSDHQRLLDRLRLYDLVELKVQGDGNCQFRALSDQIYRTTEHHQFVRQQVVDQLKLHPELYEVYVPMAYDDYLKNISKSGEWGDHVTLQAAADAYGIKIFIITSFKDTCYIEILRRNGGGDAVAVAGCKGRSVTVAYGIKIFIITSFKDTCYIEILPRTQNSKRIIFLSFWAEVHYNSIYTEGDLPPSEMKKNESWWML